MKKLIFIILAAFAVIPVFAKDFDQQRIFSAFTHNSFYMLSADEQQAWKDFCKQGNLPSEIQKSEGFAVNEISLVEYANWLQATIYASALTGYCMGIDKKFIIDEWR